MTSEIITCRDAGTGDICYRILHPAGLEIRVMEMPDFSTAYAQFGTKFGAVYRRFRLPESGQTVDLPAGTAHYLEHKLFEKEDGDVAKKFALLGASDNAFTDFDRTVYYFRTQQNYYEALALLLEFVQTPYFTAESVERERNIILQELMEALDDPADRNFEQMLEGLYHVFPLHPHILGTAESIRQITADTLLRRKCPRTGDSRSRGQMPDSRTGNAGGSGLPAGTGAPCHKPAALQNAGRQDAVFNRLQEPPRRRTCASARFAARFTDRRPADRLRSAALSEAAACRSAQ